jgi:hypothetical protein
MPKMFLINKEMSSLLTGLQCYYNLEGNGNDLSGNLNNATVSNVSFSNLYGKILQGGRFNGSSSQFFKTAPTGLPTGTVSFSFGCWVNTTNTSNFPVYIGVGDNPSINTSCCFVPFNTGELYVGLFGGDIGTGVFINDGIWHHTVCTYNSSTNQIYVYVDNAQYGPFSRTLNLPNSNIYVGLLTPPSGIQVLNGDVDECGWWSRVLTSSEVNDLWNSGNGITYPFSPPTTDSPSFLLNII